MGAIDLKCSIPGAQLDRRQAGLRFHLNPNSFPGNPNQRGGRP